ncbi:hypothetical protein L9F63_008936, partial [Diploptera punctata]
ISAATNFFVYFLLYFKFKVIGLYLYEISILLLYLYNSLVIVRRLFVLRLLNQTLIGT